MTPYHFHGRAFQRMMVALMLLSSLFVIGCSPLSQKRIVKLVTAEEKRLQNHIGLEIFDPEKGQTVFSYQSDHFFTPASNTKILTLLAGLTILNDSLPSIRIQYAGDSTIIFGLGDPCFLNPDCFNNFRAYDFLSSVEGDLYLSYANFDTHHFGPGWGWDDYNDYYSPEISPISIYGNTMRVYPLPGRTIVSPQYFAKNLRRGAPRRRSGVTRELDSNNFEYHPGLDGKFRTTVTPFRTSPSLVAQLLADTLHRKVTITNSRLMPGSKILHSIPVDSLYRVMMQDSDNHLAEQLLISCSAMLSDTLKPEIAISYMKREVFANYPDTVLWRDGSGLSRYNLVTPRFIVRAWQDIYAKVHRERLFSLLATGGQPGTLKNWYKGETPYLFGKTGTLSNNHSLSGYLTTKKGKTLIFAFMNANYVVPVSEIRNNMQRILNLYHENY